MHKKPNKKSSRPSRKGGATAPKGKHSGVTHRTGITSDETDVRLRFRSTNYVAGAGALYVKNFTPNAAYDVDPVLGSTETYGFDEYAALYSYYRVISYSYSAQISVNKNTTDPVTVYVLNTNVQPSGSRFDLYATNPYCQTKILTPGGVHANVTFRGSHQVAQILGSSTVETDDNYRALTTALPADLIWLTLAFESRGGNDVAFEYVIDIWMNVRFYGREIDLTLASTVARLTAKLEKRQRWEMEKKLSQRSLDRAKKAETPSPNSTQKH